MLSDKFSFKKAAFATKMMLEVMCDNKTLKTDAFELMFKYKGKEFTKEFVCEIINLFENWLFPQQ